MAAVLIPMYLLLVGGASVGADSAVGGGLFFGGFLLFVVSFGVLAIARLLLRQERMS